MFNFKKKQEGGWILRWGIIIIGIILILSYYGFNLREFMESDITTGNLNYIGELLNNIWLNYLKPIYDWTINLMTPFFKAILDLLSRMGNGGSISIK